MDLSRIQQNYLAMSTAANDLLGLLGPGFTGREGGHVKTDCAAAAGLAGLPMLRAKGFDLRQFTPGTMILTGPDTGMDGIRMFMTAAAAKMGLEPRPAVTVRSPAHTDPCPVSRK